MKSSHDSLSHLHGGEVEWAVSERYGIPMSEITSFASTVSPIVPETMRGLLGRFKELYLYPPKDHQRLKEILARRHGLDSGTQIILGSGSTELIHLFAQVICKGEVVIPVPTYSEYETAVTRYGGKPIFVGPGDNFDLDLVGIKQSISNRTKAIFVCNPNNPTGKLFDRRKMQSLAALSRKDGIALLVDEAYLSFTPSSKKYSMTSSVNSHPVFVLNSLSKLFGVPSIRLGWGIASEAMIQRLENFKVPWTISNLATWAAEQLLVDFSYSEMITRLIEGERDELYNQLKGIPWLEVSQTDCNFFLLRILDRGMTSTALFDHLAHSANYDQNAGRQQETGRGVEADLDCNTSTGSVICYGYQHEPR